MIEYQNRNSILLDQKQAITEVKHDTKDLFTLHNENVNQQEINKTNINETNSQILEMRNYIKKVMKDYIEENGYSPQIMSSVHKEKIKEIKNN